MQDIQQKVLNNPGDALLLFVRAPEIGTVKTRLAKDLDDCQALELYQGFVERILTVAALAGFCPTLFFCPEDKQAMMQDWLGSELKFYAQKGNDLGQKMIHAFETVFSSEVQRAVLVGSDIPGIRPDHLTDAFKSLNTHDGVIGPALDGGYWLIGFNRDRFEKKLFQDIAWSTSTVFKSTMDKSTAFNLNMAVLEMLRDVDTIDDLMAYPTLSDRITGLGRSCQSCK